MITIHTDRIEISLPVAAALLAFASKDATRPHLSAIAVEKGALCATDGHRALQFWFTEATSIHDGKAWTRQHIETLIATARARKSKSIDLAFAACADVGAFPPVHRVMPADGVRAKSAVGFNPAYFADLEKVRKACDCDGVALTSMHGEFDPVGFTIDGVSRGGLLAKVAIMPMRI